MEIKIGDTVDCSGHESGVETCKGYKVIAGPSPCGDFLVYGEWSDGMGYAYRWVHPFQITRHVPAAPVDNSAEWAEIMGKQGNKVMGANWVYGWIEYDGGQWLNSGGKPCTPPTDPAWGNKTWSIYAPKAPVVERTKSCGDKLASEMTVRTRMAMEFSASDLLHHGRAPKAEAVVKYVDDLIDALDKGRT